MLEEERKYGVPSSFGLPRIKGFKAVPKTAKRLEASYYDTEDLRLTRAGASLRYRTGDELPWTVKLATDLPGVRQEISRAGSRGRPPAELVWLVTTLTRGAPLHKVALLRTERQRWDISDGHRVVAEIADDIVTSGGQTFRELEAELKDGPPEILSTVERALLKAGATPSDWSSKIARVLNVTEPPDVVPPGEQPGSSAPAEALVTWAIRTHVRRIFAHDPLLRLNETLPNGDTPVHQLRVGARRLRSALRSFAPLLAKAWTSQLRDELSWFAGVLGAARDTEVLRARLRATAALDPLAPLDQATVEAIDAELAKRQAKALSVASKAMRSERYVQLTALLTEATQSVPFAKPSKRKSPKDAAGDLVRAVAGLTTEAPDDTWHQVRILVKRARYTAEAAGAPRDHLKSLARLQDLLGEHQDAAVAAEVWLSFRRDPAMAVTAGRLFERERALVRQAREGFSRAWQELSEAA